MSDRHLILSREERMERLRARHSKDTSMLESDLRAWSKMLGLTVDELKRELAVSNLDPHQLRIRLANTQRVALKKRI
jgi:hypothetical protein